MQSHVACRPAYHNDSQILIHNMFVAICCTYTSAHHSVYTVYSYLLSNPVDYYMTYIYLLFLSNLFVHKNRVVVVPAYFHDTFLLVASQQTRVKFVICIGYWPVKIILFQIILIEYYWFERIVKFMA